MLTTMMMRMLMILTMTMLTMPMMLRIMTMMMLIMPLMLMIMTMTMLKMMMTSQLQQTQVSCKGEWREGKVKPERSRST